MKRRKRKINLFDLGRLPTTVVQDQPRETLRLFSENELAKEKAIQDARDRENARQTAEIQEKANETIRQLVKLRASSVYDQPSEELLSRCPKRQGRDVVEGDAESISKAVLAAARKGITAPLTQSGRDKVLACITANPQLDTTKSETWTAVFGYLVELGALTEEDGVPQPVAHPKEPEPLKPTSEQTSSKTFDDSLANHSTESRSGNKELHKIVGEKWGEEVRAFYLGWADSMQTHWGYDVITEEMAKRVGDYFGRLNLSPLRHESFDQARRAFSVLGYFTDSTGQVLDLRLPAERFAAAISNDEIPLETFAERQEFNRKTRELKELQQQ